MTSAAPSPIAITKAVEAVMRADRGRLLSALIARLRDFQLAEDALQDAAMAALVHWGRSGMPQSPQGWLLRVAQRKALDRLRGDVRAERRAADLALLAEEEAAAPEPQDIPDERLRLFFTCCHPALDAKSRVALTLRTLGGLTTPEVAAVFLDTDSTMGQRLSRAKAKIAAARIPFVVPGPEDWDSRLGSVLTSIYLIFTQGYALGPAAPRDLCAEAIFLARLVNDLRPGQAETEGFMALLLLTHARATSRINAQGETVPLLEQDRGLWSQSMIEEGRALLDAAIARSAPGPFQIKAAIAALHCAAQGPDWRQIAVLYAALFRHEPSPVIALNHAVAVAEGQSVAAGLDLIDQLAADLAGFQPFHAARAEYLWRLGHADKAAAAYDRAISLAPSDADKAFLTRRKARLPDLSAS